MYITIPKLDITFISSGKVLSNTRQNYEKRLEVAASVASAFLNSDQAMLTERTVPPKRLVFMAFALLGDPSFPWDYMLLVLMYFMYTTIPK